MPGAPSPISADTDLVTFEIKTDGTEIDGAYQVVSIHVNKAVNKIPTARIVLLDGEPSEQDWPISNTKDFEPGKEIQIEAGYHSENKVIYKGIIIKHSIRVDSSRSQLIIDCKDKAVKMTVGRKSAFYEKKKDSDIIGTLIGNAGVQKKVTATSEQHKEVVQYETTDWDFMLTRAEINGMIVVVNDGKVEVGKPTVSGSPVLGIGFGESILSFDAELDAEAQYAKVKTHAWDPKTQKVVEGASQEPSVNVQGNLTGKKLSSVLGLAEFELKSSAPIVKNQLKEWANATLLRSRLAKIIGTVTFQGSSLALPDTLIELEGVGERFNGPAYVSAVEHKIEDGNWITEAKFGLSNEWFYERTEVTNPLTTGLIPAATGLQLGTVKKIHEDPDGEFRIQVIFPMVDEAKPVWARLSNFYSTNKAGAFFLPEISDEVVVGFVNSDPRYPVILGSMYSSKLNAANTPDQDNSIKAILTKAKLSLEFNDKDKIITIETPSKNQIIISDKDKKISILDQNKNKIELSSSGILLDSPKDINIKAKGKVNLEGTQGVNIKSNMDVKVEGLNVNNNGKVGFVGKGGATAELSGGGQATVKAPMVMIN